MEEQRLAIGRSQVQIPFREGFFFDREKQLIEIYKKLLSGYTGFLVPRKCRSED